MAQQRNTISSSLRSPSARLGACPEPIRLTLRANFVEGTAFAVFAVNDLLYYCRECSTNRPFYAKQSQFAGGAKIPVGSVLTKASEEKGRVASISKQSQTNPIKAKANVKMGKVFRTPQAWAEGT